MIKSCGLTPIIINPCGVYISWKDSDITREEVCSELWEDQIKNEYILVDMKNKEITLKQSKVTELHFKQKEVTNGR